MSHELIVADARALPIPDQSVHMVMTSPPYYGLRDYGIDDQLGTEGSLDGFVQNLVDVFREVHRVLRDDGTLWLNLGDTYRKKQLLGIPWRVALALQADGWYLRRDIIWHKSNGMTEVATDRPTSAHEYLFLLTKYSTYYFDWVAIQEPGKTVPWRRKRDVWKIPTQGYKGAHFSTFPEKLVEPCILAGTSEYGCCPLCGTSWTRITDKKCTATRPGNDNVLDPTGKANRDPLRHVTTTVTLGWGQGCVCPSEGIPDFVGDTHPITCHAPTPVPCTVLDPFMGTGTVGVMAARHGRDFIGVDLDPKCLKLASARLQKG